MWHPKNNLDPFLPVFSHFFMPYFDVFGSIFEKSAITDLPKVIVSICLVSYNICMIPHVWGLTFGLNLSGAWGALYLSLLVHLWFAISGPGKVIFPIVFVCNHLKKRDPGHKTGPLNKGKFCMIRQKHLMVMWRCDCFNKNDISNML